MANNSMALRKRAQIAKANRTMFLWIIAASLIVGASVVVAIFFGRNLIYNEKVLFAKNETLNVLRDNNEAVPELENAVRVLDTNDALASIKANPTDQNIQVILDALPADANSLALGASLQSKLLKDIGGLKLTSLQVTPVAGIESLDESAEVVAEEPVEGEETLAGSEINFQFSVTGSQDELKQVLVNLQRSLRLIDVRTLTIASGDDSGLTLTVEGRAFYVPAKSIEMTDKEIER